LICAKFEILKTVLLKVKVLWDVMLCHLVSRCQQFRTSLTMTQYNIPEDLDLLLDLYQIFPLRHVSEILRVLWLSHQVYMHKSGMC